VLYDGIVVGGNDYCRTEVRCSTEGREYDGGIVTVKVAGGLIGKDDRWSVDQSPGHSHTLGLPTRDFPRTMIGAFLHAQRHQQLLGVFKDVAPTCSSVKRRFYH